MFYYSIFLLYLIPLLFTAQFGRQQNLKISTSIELKVNLLQAKGTNDSILFINQQPELTKEQRDYAKEHCLCDAVSRVEEKIGDLENVFLCTRDAELIDPTVQIRRISVGFIVESTSIHCLIVKQFDDQNEWALEVKILETIQKNRAPWISNPESEGRDRLVQMITTDSQKRILVEHQEGASLQRFWNTNAKKIEKEPDTLARFFVQTSRELFRALQQLLLAQISHGDIASRNLVFAAPHWFRDRRSMKALSKAQRKQRYHEYSYMKLIDFGLAKIHSNEDWVARLSSLQRDVRAVGTLFKRLYQDFFKTPLRTYLDKVSVGYRHEAERFWKISQVLLGANSAYKVPTSKGSVDFLDGFCELKLAKESPSTSASKQPEEQKTFCETF